MTKAPERIWVMDNPYTPSEVIEYPIPNHPEYIRADHALALVAAEREACAEIVRPTPQYGKPDQLPDHEMIDMAMGSRHIRIRARTNDDAQAALEARDARIRNEALREAAEAVYCSDLKHNAYNEILALITEDQSDE